MSFTRTTIGAAISGSLAGVFLIGAIFSAGVGASVPDMKVSAPKPSPTASATPNPKECAASWKMETSDYANNRWFSEGIVEIKTAKTPEDAAKAAKVWLEGVRTDPNLLSGAAKYFLNQDVGDKATLTDDKGCGSDKAVDLAIALDLKIANAQSIVPDQAPNNGYNSGVNGGNVIGDTTPGVGGDRTAIKIILEDGTTIWVMARCGNLVTAGPPNVPPGTTDNPPKCPWNSLLPPDSPMCLQPKDPKNDVTPPQGWTPAGPDAVQPVAPPAKAEPLNPATPVTADPGPSVPVQGATPAPPAPPAPSIPAPQLPTPTDPGTPITDPDG